ncbi:oxidoreductase, short chain dehydrogenase/reductase family [Aspergillus clavatus NRRL 1]|uniref:Short-chain dehydrogenase n=1 Tax=Aspergillus clavatus (strain ATCC 1007 / CBS 513.65 / DSM 816 / NCTC 3887 / NRRL 1 / QM 1276 / 107) TaxID=344612 RepID=A1C4H3_ASPCL|nr:short-chain dehydrogenase [Aspergillus clavatus NRRL 1]EAW15313.1 short-chain dehydrogenase [Aspergillus clavatus NRRL 1]
MPPIKNSTVLIFGGTSGVGYGVADKCLSEGAIVHISSSNPSKVTEAVSSLKKQHPDSQVTGHTCDLSVNDIEQHLEKLFEEIGTVDHIVYTAGDALIVKPLQDIDLHAIHAAGHIRFVVPLLVAKLALRYLRPSYTSSLTLTTGAVSQRPYPNWSLVTGYATGLHGMVQSLALDMKPLRANLVSLGPVKTPLMGDRADAFASKTVLGKVGSPEEVAEAYVYLMKDTNATGSCVSTNAGSLLV